MARRIDGRMRLTIPQGVADALRLAPGTEMDVSIDGGALIAVAVTPTCYVCGAGGKLAEVGDDPVRHVCKTCVTVIRGATLKFR